MDKLTEEDILFLKELGHKRLIQEKDHCADPVFWMICDRENVYCEDGEFIEIYVDGDILVSTFDSDEEDIANFKEYVKMNCVDSFYDSEDLEAVEDLSSLERFISLYEYDLDISVVRFDRRLKICDTSGPFLTKDAARQHIKENKHHYSKDVNTYGMVAWRNPEFERLMSIVEQLGGEINEEV